MSSPAAPAAADQVREHLDKYTDPAKLTAHLRGGTHGQEIHVHEETDLATLRAFHRVSHETQTAATQPVRSSTP